MTFGDPLLVAVDVDYSGSCRFNPSRYPLLHCCNLLSILWENLVPRL